MIDFYQNAIFVLASDFKYLRFCGLNKFKYNQKAKTPKNICYIKTICTRPNVASKKHKLHILTYIRPEFVFAQCQTHICQMIIYKICFKKNRIKQSHSTSFMF